MAAAVLASATRRRAFTVGVGVAALIALAIPIARGAEPRRPEAAGGGPVGVTAAAEPTIGPLISGTTAQLEGTDVWTDYAYDDRGTDAGSEPTYPDEAAPGNAADLIQLQLRPDSHALDIRAVLETLTEAEAPSLGIGIDTDGQSETGAPSVRGGRWTVNPEGEQLGLERLVVIDHGGAQVFESTGTGWNDEPVGTVSASVDPHSNTVTTSIPLPLLGPTASTWRVVGVLGLTFPEHSWVAGTGPIYDLAYVQHLTTSGQTFQSEVQAAVLSGSEDAGKAVASIDVAALQAGAPSLARPVAGRKNTFLYRSHLRLGEGISDVADRKYAGPYQPYVAWFPEDGLPARPPLVVFLHGASSTHLDGSYGGSGFLVGDGATGVGPGVIDPKAVIVTPLGRNETALGYPGASEQDILDVIADASRRFGVDEDRVVLTGYSLGGVGTFNLAQHYPDRWAGAVEIVGAHDLGVLTIQEEAGGAQTMPNALENLRNLQFRMAHSRLDELELIVSDPPDQAWLAMQQLGYDFRYYQFYRREHLTFPVAMIQCELEAAIERGRVHDPAQVTYSREPAIVTREEQSGLDLHHDRAFGCRTWSCATPVSLASLRARKGRWTSPISQGSIACRR